MKEGVWDSDLLLDSVVSALLLPESVQMVFPLLGGDGVAGEGIDVRVDVGQESVETS